MKGAACEAVRHSTLEAQVDELGMMARSWAAVTPTSPKLVAAPVFCAVETCRRSRGAPRMPAMARVESAMEKSIVVAVLICSRYLALCLSQVEPLNSTQKKSLVTRYNREPGQRRQRYIHEQKETYLLLSIQDKERINVNREQRMNEREEETVATKQKINQSAAGASLRG